MANFRWKAFDEKRKQFRCLEGIDENHNPFFAANRIYGLVMWGKTQEEADNAVKNLSDSFPHIQFKLEKVG